MTNRNRGLGVLFGLAAFAAAHAIEGAMWAQWFGGAHAPWFLNSGPAVGFTIAWMFVLSLIGGLLGLAGSMMLVGALLAMATLLIWTGQDTLFPIAMTIGGVLMAFSCLLGGWLGKEAALRRGRPHS
jgi:hypothetical protein